MFEEREALILKVKKAENLHGHLGPFLVIGVKMARLAEKILSLEKAGRRDLRVLAKLPLKIPFSCILDGIQSTTQCTIGNGKLKVKNFNGGVTAIFRLKGQNKTVKVRVKRQLLETLEHQLSNGTLNEELAWKIAETPENQLFEIENR
ncbi:MAG: formylmethanofuran dehydrogenase subunit E family protein [Candidatus Bathyarchaeia archaeon]